MPTLELALVARLLRPMYKVALRVVGVERGESMQHPAHAASCPCSIHAALRLCHATARWCVVYSLIALRSSPQLTACPPSSPKPAVQFLQVTLARVEGRTWDMGCAEVSVGRERGGAGHVGVGAWRGGPCGKLRGRARTTQAKKRASARRGLRTNVAGSNKV